MPDWCMPRWLSFSSSSRCAAVCLRLCASRAPNAHGSRVSLDMCARGSRRVWWVAEARKGMSELAWRDWEVWLSHLSDSWCPSPPPFDCRLVAVRLTGRRGEGMERWELHLRWEGCLALVRLTCGACSPPPLHCRLGAVRLTVCTLARVTRLRRSVGLHTLRIIIFRPRQQRAVVRLGVQGVVLPETVRWSSKCQTTQL